MRLSNKAKMAVLIGTLCSVSYFAVYIARNILSAVSPQMVDSGIAESYITTASAVYFYVYAVGQLINGIIGDKIKARYMISLGLILAGVCNVIYPFDVQYSNSCFFGGLACEESLRKYRLPRYRYYGLGFGGFNALV